MRSLLITLMTEAVITSEMSVCYYDTTRCNIPEGCHLHALPQLTGTTYQKGNKAYSLFITKQKSNT
jgi:hypothetical protein